MAVVRSVSFLLLFAAINLGSTQPLPAPKWPHPFQFPQTDDYEVLLFSGAVKPTFNWSKQEGRFKSGKPYSAFIGILKGDPTYFSIKLPQQGCLHVQKTSETAQVYKCLYATNGGYFGVSSGACIGNLITDSKVIQITGDQRANFGMTKTSFVIGYLTNETIKGGQFNFTQLIQGAGWLVRNGASFINQSKTIESLSNHFVEFEAPRTALGVFKNGSVILAEFDGSEVIGEGASLYDLADWLAKLGVYHAINLDGGGSSVSVYKGQVISRPTCDDIPYICERAVTSITCVNQLP